MLRNSFPLLVFLLICLSGPITKFFVSKLFASSAEKSTLQLDCLFITIIFYQKDRGQTLSYTSMIWALKWNPSPPPLVKYIIHLPSKLWQSVIPLNCSLIYLLFHWTIILFLHLQLKISGYFLCVVVGPVLTTNKGFKNRFNFSFWIYSISDQKSTSPTVEYDVLTCLAGWDSSIRKFNVFKLSSSSVDLIWFLLNKPVRMIK